MHLKPWFVIFILLSSLIIPVHATFELIERNKDWDKYGDNVTIYYDPETHEIEIRAIPVDLHASPCQINYLDDNNTWQPINTTLIQLDDNSLLVDKAPYKLNVFANRTGYRVFPDRRNNNAWLEFRLPDYFYENTTKVVNKSAIYYYGDNYTLKIHSKHIQVAFEWIIENQSVFDTISRNFTITIIPHNTAILSDGTIEGFDAKLINKITDSNGTEIIPNWTYNEETHQLNFYINDSNLSYPIVVDPTVDINPGSGGNDGYVYGQSTSYATARTTASASDDTSKSCTIGQDYVQFVIPPVYRVYRTFLKFDTSSIPSDATITSAKLRLYGSVDQSVTDFYIRLTKWTGDTPINTGDYLQVDGLLYDDGLFSTSSFTTSGYNDITISNYNLIVKGGYTKIAVVSSRDVNGNPPTGREFVSVASYESGSGRYPLLHIEYILPNEPPKITNPYPANGSINVKLQPTCHVAVTDADGDTMTIRWYENSTGSWVLRQTNSGVGNGTYYWTFTQANSYSTTYWWKVTANDGTDTTTEIYHFTTVPEPSVTINFAGNPGDLGGPYCIPPSDNDSTAGPYASDGYYTNASYQNESWIYINCTVNGAHIERVWLNWYSKDADTWTNWTYQLSNTGGNYWAVNTSSIISPSPGNYSFDIYLNTSYATNYTKWTKTGTDTEQTRRYVYLSAQTNSSNFEYRPFYCYNAGYSQTAIDNHKLNDILHHDQGIDGTLTDTGYLLADIPTDTVNERSCSIFLGYWFDESVSIPSINLTNIYQHFWWNVSWWTGVGWNKSRAKLDNTITDSYVPTSIENTSITYGGHIFNLSCHKINLTNPVEITDNNVYEICGLKLYGSYVHAISNRSFTSFVIFNIPDNTTLQGMDSDSDNINDYQELFVYYTNPFLSDTDNDGYSDYSEVVANTNPNVYTDFPTNAPPSLKNPSVTPTSGVADYTTFYFNVTWADADGDSPADGYLKVNISKTGWYLNVSMNYVSGSNTTGALYTYSTTLSAGTYQYTFYAYDGTDTNSSGPHSNPSVSAQDLSFTIYTSSADGNISFTADVTPGQGLTTCYNISATGQDATTPALKVVNTGNVPLNFTWKLDNALPSGLQLKYNYTNNPPLHNQNTITTTEYQFATSVPVSGDNKTWMWMDFVNVYGGSGQENMTINSTFGG